MNKSLKGIVLAGLLAIPALGALTACNKATPGPGFSFWYTFSKNAESKLFVLGEKFVQYIQETEGKKITIDYQKYGGYPNIKEKIEKGLSVGNIPTMAVAYPDHVANYMEKGREEGDAGKYVWKLDDFMVDPEIGFGKQVGLDDDPDHPNDFFEPFMEEGKKYIIDGTYSLPLMKSTEALCYNETLLRKYLNGYEPYTTSGKTVKKFMDELTWDSFMDLCEFVRADLNKPADQQLVKGTRLTHVLGYDSDANLFITRLYQQSIGYSSINKATGRGIIDFNKDVNVANFNAVVDDLTELRDLHQRKILLTRKTNSDKYCNDKFTQQEILFTVGSTGGADYNEPKGDAFTTSVTKVPECDTSKASWITQGVTLCFMKNPTLSDQKNMENMRYAWQFAKFLTNPKNNVSLCFNSQGYFPVRKSALETEEWQEIYDDPESIRTKTMDAITNQIKHRYFNSALFKGSAELREEVGSLLAQALIDSTGSKSSIENLVTTAVNNALRFM